MASKVRTYKVNLEKGRVGLSPDQIHRNKCATKHNRNVQRSKFNKEQEENRAKLAPAKQVEALDFRLGKGIGAVKERKKLLTRLS